MLFGRRKRLEKMAEEERLGKSFWTSEFSESVRARLVHAYDDAAGSRMTYCASLARGLILRDEGKFYLTNSSFDEANDFFEYLLACNSKDMPTVVEAMYVSMARERMSGVKPWLFQERVEEILRESRISFDFIDGKMVEFSSREMHVAVVAPTIRLLAGNVQLTQVESAYQDALKELSDGNGSDAITDAGTALQELLVALGCSGNALGPLIRSARSNGIVAAHDVRFLEGLATIMHWVSADRSESGDAHSASKVAVEDAWLTVHVVGALILRLADSKSKRGES